MNPASQYRAFGSLSDEQDDKVCILANEPSSSFESWKHQIHGNIMGSLCKFSGPYGIRPCVYSDWTASGRSVRQV